MVIELSDKSLWFMVTFMATVLLGVVIIAMAVIYNQRQTIKRYAEKLMQQDKDYIELHKLYEARKRES